MESRLWLRRRSSRLQLCQRLVGYSLAAVASVDPSAVYRGALLRWRRELSVTLQLGNAQVLARSIGMPPLDGCHAAPDSEGDVACLILERGF